MQRHLFSATCALLLCTTPWSTAQGVVTGSSLPGPYGDRSPRPLPEVLYVDAAAMGANDGSSWEDAFVDLQDALATAGSGQQVWVVAGTYKPAPPGGPSSATFALPGGVGVYGGFAGGETSLQQRDINANPTTLSADLNGDDTYFPVFNVGFGDNVWHVVTLDGTDSSTRLDGFEILGGSAFGSPPGNANGAGIRITNGAGTVANSSVSWCVGNHGGGLFAGVSDVVIESCDFHNNYGSSSGFAGGALANDAGSSVTVRDSTFTANTADGVGAGIAGGAIANALGATLIVERCTFTSNVAANRLGGSISIARGGAIYNERGTVVIRESTFTSNTSNSGGAVFGWGTASTTIRSSLFDGNYVTKYILSGGIEGGGDGGTVVGGTGLVMTGCLVYDGTADNIGGVSAGAGQISGCVFWNNQDDKGNIGISQIKADEVRYSCVQNMLVGEPGEDPPDPEKFPGSISTDPLFLNELGGDYRPSASSPLIDAGENSAWPLTTQVDLDGNPRFLDDPATPDTGIGPAPVVDMGPYEYAGAALARENAPRLSRLSLSSRGSLCLEIRAGVAHAGLQYLAAAWDGDGGLLLRSAGHLDTNGAASEARPLPAAAFDLLSDGGVHHAVVVLGASGEVLSARSE